MDAPENLLRRLEGTFTPEDRERLSLDLPAPVWEEGTDWAQPLLRELDGLLRDYGPSGENEEACRVELRKIAVSYRRLLTLAGRVDQALWTEWMNALLRTLRSFARENPL